MYLGKMKMHDFYLQNSKFMSVLDPILKIGIFISYYI